MTERHAEGIEEAALALVDAEHDHLTQGELTYAQMAQRVVAAYLEHAHPVVDGMEGLDALPVGTVVFNSNGNAWQRAGRNWYVAGASGGQKAVPHLPARVIWWVDQ